MTSPFRYYIVDLIDGTVKGTSDLAIVEIFRESEDATVIDTEQSLWIMEDGRSAVILDMSPF